MTAALVNDRIVDALAARFSPRLTADEVASYVEAAVRDLSGSVSAESLPEMAIRLAAVRMERTRLARDT